MAKNQTKPNFHNTSCCFIPYHLFTPHKDFQFVGFHSPIVRTVVDTKNCTHSVYTVDLSMPIIIGSHNTPCKWGVTVTPQEILPSATTKNTGLDLYFFFGRVATHNIFTCNSGRVHQTVTLPGAITKNYIYIYIGWYCMQQWNACTRYWQYLLRLDFQQTG